MSLKLKNVSDVEQSVVCDSYRNSKDVLLNVSSQT